MNKMLSDREQSKNTVTLSGLGRGLLVSIATFGILAVTAFLCYFGFYSARDIVERPIAKVSVESNFHYIDRQHVTQLLNHTLRRGFINENLNMIKAELEKNAWIDQVVLSRQWPDQLQVKIVEQAPIARWSDTGFINSRGELVAINDVKQLQHLPHLAGPSRDSTELLKQYQTIAKLLRKYDLEVASLTKSQDHRWIVELTNGWQINVGKGQLMEKMQRFAMLLKSQSLADRNDIAVIDMRYPNGVAIKWLENDNNKPVLDAGELSFVDGI